MNKTNWVKKFSICSYTRASSFMTFGTEFCSNELLLRFFRLFQLTRGVSNSISLHFSHLNIILPPQNNSQFYELFCFKLWLFGFDQDKKETIRETLT